MNATRLIVLASFALVLAGCATTTGRGVCLPGAVTAAPTGTVLTAALEVVKAVAWPLTMVGAAADFAATKAPVCAD